MTDKQIQDYCDKGLHNETNIVMEVRPIPFSIAGYYVTIKCNGCGKVFIKERLTNYTEYTDRTNKTIDNLKAENNELKKNYFTVIQQRNKAEKTLTEIKEIIRVNKTNRLSGGACISIEQILQKISEVEDEYNG